MRWLILVILAVGCGMSEYDTCLELVEADCRCNGMSIDECSFYDERLESSCSGLSNRKQADEFGACWVDEYSNNDCNSNAASNACGYEE